MPEESVMRQAMTSWLKAECVEVAKDTFLLSAAINSVLDSIFSKEPIHIILENVDYLLTDIDDLKPIITEEQYNSTRSEATKAKDIIKTEKRKLSDEEISQVLNAMGNIRRSLPIIAGEAIVKCQIGKSSRSNSSGQEARFTKGQTIVIKSKAIYGWRAWVTVEKDDPEHNQVWVKEITPAVKYEDIEEED